VGIGYDAANYAKRGVGGLIPSPLLNLVNKTKSKVRNIFASGVETADRNVIAPLVDVRNKTVTAVTSVVNPLNIRLVLILLVLGFGVYIFFNLKGLFKK
jgi:hypothetical protein